MLHFLRRKRDHLSLMKPARTATENICADCGRRFILRRRDYEYFESRSWNPPVRCRACRKRLKEAREAEERAKRERDRQAEREAMRERFERELAQWSVKSFEDVRLDSSNALFVIGNGFDLMHGARSSYYAFRDSLGKNSRLRRNLEAFIAVDDLWADFETALGKIDMDFFGGARNVADWLENMDAFDGDAGAAEFFLACDMATQPVRDIAEDLERRFGEWVAKLALGTDDRPLAQLFEAALAGGGRGHPKVLNFNYTEFVEDVYGVPREQVCYIHGCRRKEKGSPKPKLVLGHAPRVNDFMFDTSGYRAARRDAGRRETVAAAQDVVARSLLSYDVDFTKDCARIIEAHAEFFESLEDVDAIVVIGHSLSEVDWPYFDEIMSRIRGDQVHWHLSCHGLGNLEAIDRFLCEYRIDREDVTIFRTDTIRVAMCREPAAEPPVQSPKERCVSPDEKWVVRTLADELQIMYATSGSVSYQVEFPGSMKRLFFLDDKLILVSGDFEGGIFVFERGEGGWGLSCELSVGKGRRLLTRSLDRVMHDGDRLVFVYNNRVKELSLVDGSMTRSEALRDARHESFPGIDVTRLFWS